MINPPQEDTPMVRTEHHIGRLAGDIADAEVKWWCRTTCRLGRYASKYCSGWPHVATQIAPVEIPLAGHKCRRGAIDRRHAGGELVADCSAVVHDDGVTAGAVNWTFVKTQHGVVCPGTATPLRSHW